MMRSLRPHFSVPGICACLGATLSALAQTNGVYFDFPNGNVYDGTSPVIVEGWAVFDTQYYAWAGFGGGVLGSDPLGEWQNFVYTANTAVCKGCPPQIGGGNIKGIITGQLHFPPLFFANTANPIKIFTVEWTTNDLTKRVVDIQTATTKYSVYVNSLGNTANLTPEQHFAEIRVVPAPGSIGLVALSATILLLPAGRRRDRVTTA